MMVFGKSTGWECFERAPARFFRDVLGLPSTDDHLEMMRCVAAGASPRIGTVVDQVDNFIDLQFIMGMILWRSLSQQRPTIIWGGRRARALAWIEAIHSQVHKSVPELFRNVRLIYDSERFDIPWGLTHSTNHWLVRYDGPFEDDVLRAAQAHPNADILICDFSWTDRKLIDQALRTAGPRDSIIYLPTGYGER